MRAAPTLVLILLLCGCVHLADSASLRQALAADLATRPICMRVPGTHNGILRSNGMTLVGDRLPDGRSVFEGDSGPSAPGPAHRAYDLLVALGLFRDEEQAVPARPSRVTRRYTPTPAGEAHLRLVPGGHGAAGWIGLCYGTAKLVAVEGVGPVERAPCRIRQRVTFTYLYDEIPDWVQDPRLRDYFPDIVTRDEGSVPRRRERSFLLRNRQWYLEDLDVGTWPVACIQ
jgi:hypothetical protein